MTNITAKAELSAMREAMAGTAIGVTLLAALASLGGS